MQFLFNIFTGLVQIFVISELTHFTGNEDFQLMLNVGNFETLRILNQIDILYP